MITYQWALQGGVGAHLYRSNALLKGAGQQYSIITLLGGYTKRTTIIVDLLSYQHTDDVASSPLFATTCTIYPYTMAIGIAETVLACGSLHINEETLLRRLSGSHTGCGWLAGFETPWSWRQGPALRINMID